MKTPRHPRLSDSRYKFSNTEEENTSAMKQKTENFTPAMGQKRREYTSAMKQILIFADIL